jgi:quercetin dioxygenase-like cupin family protein
MGVKYTNPYKSKRIFMKIFTLIFSLLLLLITQTKAFPQDQHSAVKATVILNTETSWDGKPIEYPVGKAEITSVLVEVPVGGETGWHLHPIPSFGMVLEGELEIQLKSGDVKRLKAGDAVAEGVNTLHNGRNIGSTPVKLVVFYVGIVGQKLSVKEITN